MIEMSKEKKDIKRFIQIFILKPSRIWNKNKIEKIKREKTPKFCLQIID